MSAPKGKTAAKKSSRKTARKKRIAIPTNKQTVFKRPRGRPSTYKPEYADLIREHASAGATFYEIADIIGVSDYAVRQWAAQFPDFAKAVRVVKAEADDKIERSIYERARGYDVEVEKVFHNQGSIVRTTVLERVPPDPALAKFWLTNRRPERWRDRQDVEVKGNFTLMDLVTMSYQIEEDAAQTIEGTAQEVPDDPPEPERTR